MVDWKPYLESICEKYAQWWDSYTLTNVVGNKFDKKVRKCLLLDLQAIALKPETVKPEREEFLEARKEREVFNVLEGLRKYAPEHVLLTGRPGSGKSTALVRLLLEEAEKTSPQTPLRSGEGLNIALPSLVGKGVGGLGQIPVLVELRYYETSILDLITAFLHRHDPSLTIDCETIKTLLRQGQFLLLIDGVNELPSPEAQRNLQKFRQDYQQNTPMVFTTRDLGVGGDLGISKKLEMQPLTETQMGEFVRGYLPETGEQMLQQLGGRLREFGETPLLLMMLCSVFASNGNQIPPNLGSVFRRFTEIYDGQLKQDIPVTDESRRWWKRLLQHLAWVMMTSPQTPLRRGEGLNQAPPSLAGKGVGGLGQNAKTEFLVAISRQQAEEIFTEYLEGKVNCAADCAISWLNDLLKHHLIQIGAENKIEFRHQLIQEYYAAERFLQEVGKLSDDELQWDYLNYLKWTEPAALMLGLLDDEGLALRVVRLALQVDWQLGARLAGEVKLEWQEKTVGLISELSLPQLLEIRLLGISKSYAAVKKLLYILTDEDYVDRYKRSALTKIGSINQVIKYLSSSLLNKNNAVYSLANSILIKISSYDVFSNLIIINDDLIQALNDEDSDVRSFAVQALGNIGSENNTLVLIKVLGDKDYRVRISVIEALRNIGTNAAINGIIQALNDEDSAVRSSAAQALGNIGSETNIPVLIKVLGDKDYRVRISVIEALRNIGTNAAINGIIQALNDEDSAVRSSAAQALGNIGSETNIPVLIKVLGDKDSYVRISAAEALGNVAYEATIPVLIKALSDEDSDVRTSAIELLGNIGSDAAIDGLIKALNNEDSDVRTSAIELLGNIGSDAAIDGLIKALNNEDSDVRTSAIELLGNIGSDAAIDGLIKALNNEDSDVRTSAIELLGNIGSDAAIDGLIKALKDNEHSIRDSALEYLIEIDNYIALDGLIEALNSQCQDVIDYAREQIDEIREKIDYEEAELRWEKY